MANTYESYILGQLTQSHFSLVRREAKILDLNFILESLYISAAGTDLINELRLSHIFVSGELRPILVEVKGRLNNLVMGNRGMLCGTFNEMRDSKSLQSI